MEKSADNRTSGRAWRLVRIAAMLLVLIALGVGLWWLRPWETQDLFANLVQARSSMDLGEQAWRNKDYPLSLQHWQQAAAQVSATEKRLERKKKKELKGDQADAFRTALGELQYLKARCLRDQEFARAGVDGKPISETMDTTTGERFRSFLAVPDGEQRKEAVKLLRTAAQLSPRNADILLDALRTELMTTPLNWQNIQPLAQAIVQLRPDDTRALYWWARYEFEQPSGNPPVPFQPAAKRSPERVAKALELARKARGKDEQPSWRIVHLEAQIQLWRLQDARRRPGADARQISAEFDELFWNDATGALARLQKAGDANTTSQWTGDVDGMLDTPLIALEVLREQRGAKSENESKGRTIVETYLAFCQKKLAANDVKFPRRILVDRATQAVNLAVTLWVHLDQERWTRTLATLQDLFQLDSPTPTGSAGAYAQLAYLLMAEKSTPEMIDKVFAAGRSAGDRPEASSLSYHAAWGYWKVAQGQSRKDITVHLQALGRGKSATFEGHLLDGLVNLRDGLLQKANDESTAALPMAPAEQRLRAHLLQAKTQLGLGHYEKALATLRFLGGVCKDDLPVALRDRLWFRDHFQSAADIDYWLGRTHLDIARDRVVRFRADKPRVDPPESLTELHEKEADTMLKRLPTKSVFRAYLRQEKISYLLFRQRLAAANAELQMLQTEFPDSLAALSARLLVVDQISSDEIDARAELRKEWAAALAKSPSNRNVGLMMAVLETRAGKREAGLALMKRSSATLPGDQLYAEHLVVLADMIQDTDKREASEIANVLQSAMQRHPFDPRLTLALGMMRVVAGDTRAASVQLQRTANLCRNPIAGFNAEQLRALAKTANQILAAP